MADVSTRWKPAERSNELEKLANTGELQLIDRWIKAGDLIVLLAEARKAGIAVPVLQLAGSTIQGNLHLGEWVPERLFCPRVTFKGRLFGWHVTFASSAQFDNAIFELGASFIGASFNGPVSFRGTVFDNHPQEIALELERTTFHRRAIFQASARRIDLQQVRFEQGVDLFLRHAVVTAEDTTFGAPSLISDSSHEGPDDDYLRRCGYDQRPRVESLRRADVGNLTLSNVDTAGCHFRGAHGLDKLRLEGNPTFAETPKTRRWTRRRILAEEADVRTRAGEPGWQSRRTSPVDESRWRPERYLDFRDVESIYRALRKGLEERRDEPGAADFYYGEMEMRRRAARNVERTLVWLYWLVSGYGLRASRAFLALLVTITVCALLYGLVGLDPDPSWWRAALFSVESTSSIFRVPAAPGHTLNEWGELVQVGERLLGPLFIALTLISIRGRVKR